MTVTEIPGTSDLDRSPQDKPPKNGLAVSFSGGGYRAMLFHLGAAWALRQAGLLEHTKAFSSVSGGSIMAGVLGLRWREIDWHDDGTSFRELVATPVMDLAHKTIDVPAGLIGRIPGLAGKWTRGAYDKHLYGFAKLADLPSTPRFTFNATSLASGKLFRMHAEYLACWNIGQWFDSGILLSEAVAASSAFPPVLSPVTLDLSKARYKRAKEYAGKPLDHIHLTDGGVYDNLGVQTLWRNYRTVLVCDAGAGFAFDAGGDWLLTRGALRVTGILQDQIASLRFIQMKAGYEAAEGDSAHRKGGIVSIWQHRHDVAEGREPALDPELGDDIAGIKTRLAKLEGRHVRRLVNWGYVASSTKLDRLGLGKPLGPMPFPRDWPSRSTGG